jgi:lipoate-protein ligase A
LARPAPVLERPAAPDSAAAYQLPHTAAPGAAQMSADAALLAWAASGRSRIVFRTYSWERPTLSLGRAEPFPAGWDWRALQVAGVDVVRRPTGGDAVLHERELTFAVAASLPGPWRLRPRAFAEIVADALAFALRGFDIPAVRVRAAESGTPPARPGEQLCFARAAAGEVRVGEFKVAGIASRFTRGAALSHASVPLGPGHRDIARYREDPGRHRAALEHHARSAAELSGRELPAGLLGDRVSAFLSASIGAAFVGAAFPDLGIETPGGAVSVCYRSTP